MLRKYFQVLMIFLAILAILSCDKLLGPSPNEVLKQYLDATQKERYEEAYSYVSGEDKTVKDLQSYLKEKDTKDSPFTEAIISIISYKILNLEKSDKTATAIVEITSPDMESIFSDIMGTAYKSAFSGGDEHEIEKAMTRKLESGEVPLKTEKETFRLIKEKDGWKVFLDWKTEKIEKEKQAMIKTLMTEAEDLRKSKKLEGAIEKYEKVLILDAEMVDAREGIEKVKTEIKQIEEKQSYVKNVVLYDLQARYYETYLDKIVPGVEFKIKNKGNRQVVRFIRTGNRAL